MDFRSVEGKIVQWLAESDTEFLSDNELHSSDSEEENNVETEVHVPSEESKEEASDSSGDELLVSRRGRNRRLVLDSDDDTINTDQAESSSDTQTQVPQLHPTVIQPSQRNLYGKNRHRWSTNPRDPRTRTSSRNVIHVVPGPSGLAKEVSEPKELFQLFVTEEMIDAIVQFTNADIDIKSNKYKLSKFTTSQTSANEVKALLGLLIQSAALKTMPLNNDLVLGILNDGNCSELDFDDDDEEFIPLQLENDEEGEVGLSSPPRLSAAAVKSENIKGKASKRKSTSDNMNESEAGPSCSKKSKQTPCSKVTQKSKAVIVKLPARKRFEVAETHICTPDRDRRDSSSLLETQAQTSGRYKPANHPSVGKRFDGYEHFPIFDDLKAPRKCRSEICSCRSKIRCRKCDIYLCLSRDKDCFFVSPKKQVLFDNVSYVKTVI
ncbi:unnamed protein product [Parnassius apollo]|uniref:(apollo) hypothetical protein n=1 Tax=Parnassius apollo TaxID=110799 RepID=A0A8S3WEH1_PARAO|nr:unnamed protein product [Parnassius apollo]